MDLILVFVDFDGVLRKDFGFDEREVGLHYLPHPVPYGVDFVVLEEICRMVVVFSHLAFTDFAVQAAGKGMVYDEDLVRVHFPDHLLKNEAKGTDVAPSSVGLVVGEELYIMGGIHPEGKFLQFVVDQCRKDLIAFPRLRVFYLWIPFLGDVT